MKNIIIRGRKVVGGKVKGEALVSREPICFLGGVDVKSGIITEKGHHLEGKSVADKILVFPIGKGSTGGSYLIYETAENGKGPKAIINIKADSVTVVGCIIANITMMVDLEKNPLELISDGDIVEVDGDVGTITITPDDAGNSN